MTPTLTELVEHALKLRAAGATRVSHGPFEVEFAPLASASDTVDEPSDGEIAQHISAAEKAALRLMGMGDK